MEINPSSPLALTANGMTLSREEQVQQVKAFLSQGASSHAAALEIDPASLTQVGPSAADPNRPTLTPPAAEPAPSANAPKTLFGILAMVGEIVARYTVNKLVDAANDFIRKAEGQQAGLEALDTQYQQALDTLEADKIELEKVTEPYTQANSAYRAAKLANQQAKDALAKLSPSDPGYAAAEQEAASAQAREDGAKTSFDEAQQTFEQANAKTEAALKTAKDLYDKFPPLQAQLHPEDNQRLLDYASQLTLLLAKLADESNDLTIEGLKAHQKQYEMQQVAIQESMDRKQKEYDEKVAKQAAISKGVNCAMKILGAIVTAVSVVAAVFTGGASLAIAAVGIGLMVADKIVEKTTGTGLIARAMKPLMEHVLKPLVNLLSKGISKMLEAFGMAKDLAEQIGSIVGSVLGAVAMVAAMAGAALFAKSAVPKMAASLAKHLGKSIAKMVPQVLKNGAAKMGELLAKPSTILRNALGETGSARIANRLDMAANLGRGAQAVTVGATSTVLALSEQQVQDLQVEMNLQEAILRLLTDIMESKLESFKSMMQTIQNMLADSAVPLGTHQRAMQAVLNNIGHVAA